MQTIYILNPKALRQIFPRALHHVGIVRDYSNFVLALGVVISGHAFGRKKVRLVLI